MSREPTPESPAEAVADALLRAEREHPLPRPIATYRLQLHGGFRFADVERIADYLAALGVSDVYCSPYLHARPGSTHGYDVFDHGRINPEIGDETDDARLARTLDRCGLGRVLDIVPNHMGIAGPNPYWLDVLESGPYAASARFFDIDWDPVKEELNGRVLLPILEDHYGTVLEQGLIELARDGGAFHFRYHERRLPLAPHSFALVLGHRPDAFAARFNPDDEHAQEYRSIWSAAANLPDARRAGVRPRETLLREKEVIKRRIARLCQESPELGAFLDANIAEFHGTPGEPASFDALHALLEQQAYRLAYWRVAAEEINYRRFFDVNDLAGIRVEDPRVFDFAHRRIVEWVDRGDVKALRIDHPDGLADPLGYLRRLQETLLLRACRTRFERQAKGGPDWEAVEPALLRRYRDACAQDPTSEIARRFPVVVEKILSRGEDLPEDWPVDGTVGYGFLNVVNSLFVDPAGAGPIEEAYASFTGDRAPMMEVLYQSKQLIMRASLASELNVLARALNRVSETDRHSRDFTLNDLRRALREVIACFPVYRTYIRPDEPLADRDERWVGQAIARARRRNPTTDESVFDFIRDALLLRRPPADESARREREAFALRFQQTTGPAQAKGLEDTAFYRSVRLASLNEVGADPLRFGVNPVAFHELCQTRLRKWPGALGSTATHDTKRGEDTRPRISVLSEIPHEWSLHLGRWAYWNAHLKPTVGDSPVPDAREEYLIYQTLLGAWPADAGDEENAPEGLAARVQQYIIKAAREAKVNTSWTDGDPAYTEALAAFVAAILEGPDRGPFLRDFVPFQRRIARVAVFHSLSQILWKLTAPGVPDIYQGNELWDFSLVDPDNRRPVDYDRRRDLLGRIDGALRDGRPRSDLAAELLAAPADGAIKLYLVTTLLRHRREQAALYAQGGYRALEVDGPQRNQVVAFARSHDRQVAIVAGGRLLAGLMGPEGTPSPLGPEAWAETRLLLPDPALPRAWRDVLTDRRVVAGPEGELALGEIFGTLTAALLVPDSPGGS